MHRWMGMGALLSVGWGACWIATAATTPGAVESFGLPPVSANTRAIATRYVGFRAARLVGWHPRQRDVLVAARRGDATQLHLVSTPGGSWRTLTQSPEPVTGGMYLPGAPDRIIYLQDLRGDEEFQMARLDLPTGALTFLTEGGSRHVGVVPSRRGDRLAFATTRRDSPGSRLHVMDPGTPGSDRCLVEGDGGGWMVRDWSPDDRRLLAIEYRSVRESHLHLIDLAHATRRFLQAPGDASVFVADACFSGDGRSAIVVTDLESEFRRVMVVDLESEQWSPGGVDGPGEVEEMDLSDDGRLLAVVRNVDGASRLQIRDLGQGRDRPVPELEAGVITGIRWHSSRPELGFSWTTPRMASTVCSLDSRRGRLTRWTEGATLPREQDGTGEPFPIRVHALDGVELTGLLYRPSPSRFPGRRPVLLMFHGGPESQARPSFLGRWHCLLREQGVAILLPNVRGSTGFGKSFVSLDDGMRREDVLGDVRAFLDWIGTDAGLDGGRVGVYGTSYGGYLAMTSLIHHGHHLRCGVMAGGIVDFVDFLQTTAEFRRDLRRAEYGDERDPRVAAFLRDISPRTRVSEIQRPVLVIQGGTDTRVASGPATEFVEALRRQGTTAGYLIANDEGHGFRKKSNTIEAFAATVGFLEEHLLGAVREGGDETSPRER